MRILGIDPGMSIIGYSIVDFEGEGFTLVSSGSIRTTSQNPDPVRLAEIHRDLSEIIKKFSPEVASCEKLFFFKNQKTVMPVAQARGVILMTLGELGIPVAEYTPMEVKMVLTGYGRADKKEVQRMVQITMSDTLLPKLDDTVDSIAIAICHARSCITGVLVQK